MWSKDLLSQFLSFPLSGQRIMQLNLGARLDGGDADEGGFIFLVLLVGGDGLALFRFRAGQVEGSSRAWAIASWKSWCEHGTVKSFISQYLLIII